MRRSNRGLKILIFGSIAGLYLGAIGSVALHETKSHNFMWDQTSLTQCDYLIGRYGPATTGQHWQFMDSNFVWHTCPEPTVYDLAPPVASPQP